MVSIRVSIFFPEWISAYVRIGVELSCLRYIEGLRMGRSPSSVFQDINKQTPLNLLPPVSLRKSLSPLLLKSSLWHPPECNGDTMYKALK